MATDSGLQPETNPKSWTAVSKVGKRAADFGTKYYGLATIIAVIILIAYQIPQINRQLEHAAMTTVYSEQNEVSRFIAENHFVREYFYKDDLNENQKLRDQRLRIKFKNEKEPKRAQLLMVAEVLANCAECVYQMRNSLPKNDWNAWWISFQDQYDESPILQDYFEQRNRWYSVDDFLRIHDPVLRDKSLRRWW